jgi:hypothetical protein
MSLAHRQTSGDVINEVQGSGFIRHVRHLVTAPMITDDDAVIAEALAAGSVPALIAAAQYRSCKALPVRRESSKVPGTNDVKRTANSDCTRVV